MSRFGGYDDKPFLAELYDLVPAYSNRRDLAFYVDLCRQAGGKVLELGCGTGRVLIPIASAGVEIVGLDLSTHMLAKCRQNLTQVPQEVQSRVKLILSSMTDFSLGESFRAAIIPFRPFQHLVSVADQLSCLRSVNAHLPIGGTLAFDVFQVNFQMISDPSRKEEWEDLPLMDLPDGRKMRRCSRFAGTHRAEQYNDIEIIYYVTDREGKTDRLVHPFPFRYFFRYEVEHLLARTGFEMAQVYGDFDRSPLGDDSPEMVFVARKTAEARNIERKR